MEKQFRKVENRLEVDYTTLREENKELREWQRQDKWTIHGLLTCMEAMEARMALVSSQVTAVVLSQQVGLSTEEDEGGVGGPIEFRSPFRLRSPFPHVFTREELDAMEVVERNWEFRNQGELATGGDYTPAVPWAWSKVARIELYRPS